MEQSDIDLLQTVPAYHLQSLVRTRRLPMAMKGQSAGTASAASTPPSATAASSSSSVTKPITGNLAVSSADAQEVAASLFKPAVISEALRGCGPIERLLLRELVFCGGRANSRDLALYMVSSGLLGTGKIGDAQPSYTLIPGSSLYPQPHPHGPFEQALHHLLMLGLLFWGKQTNFAGRDYTNGVYDGVLIVPHAVRQVLLETPAYMEEEFAAIPAATATGDTRDTGNIGEMVGEQDVGEGARSLQRMLYLYWSCVASTHDNGGAHGLALVQSGLLARSSLRQLVEALYPRMRTEQVRAETDIPHMLFLRLLLLKLGLLRVARGQGEREQNGVLVALSARAFFEQPVLERARRCYRLWLETPLWNELVHLPEVALRPTPAPMEPAQPEIMQGHQAVIDRLLQERLDVWHDVMTFVARTKLYLPNLLFPRQYGPRTERYSMGSNPYGWDFRLRRGWLTPREGWYQVEGGFIRAVLTGPLHWLGLLETKTEEKRTLFRRSPGFALIVGDTVPESAGEPPGRLIVQPNFELVALAPVSEALLIGLDRFAERVSLEHVAQYRLTKASVTRAIQRGLRADDIQQVLEEASGGEIPQNVRYSLGEWERQARRIELWQGMTLLEVDDPQVLDELFSDETAAPMLGRRLSLTLAEVVTARLPALQTVLWQRDYLPAHSTARSDDLLENTHPESTEPQWRLQEDGLLRPLYPVPDLYLAAEMERFTDVNEADEANEANGWRRITPASMQRATSAGLPLAAIIRFLQRSCTDGVPASFLIRLKLWSGGYNAQPTIQVEQSPLLYLSAQVLQDLQSDEAISGLLGDALPEQGRFVRVPRENLAQVVALLRERGFTME